MGKEMIEIVHLKCIHILSIKVQKANGAKSTHKKKETHSAHWTTKMNCTFTKIRIGREEETVEHKRFDCVDLKDWLTGNK